MLVGYFASTMGPTHVSSSRKGTRGTASLSRARKLLRGVVREDSDDELGDEDIPWEWAYSAEPDTFDQVGREEINGEKRTIVGARMGGFDVAIGDCVFIKGEGLQGEAYVGMICEFQEEQRAREDGGGMEMMANVMWFSTEFEVKNKEKKRMDYLPVGLLAISSCPVVLTCTYRTSSTSTRRTISARCPPSTAGQRSYRQPSTASCTPAASPRSRGSTARSSSAAGAATRGPHPTPPSSTGTKSTKAETPTSS